MQPIYIPLYGMYAFLPWDQNCVLVDGEERMKMVRVDLINNFGYG